MTRPAAQTLSSILVVAALVGAMLVTPATAGATAALGGRVGGVAAGSAGIDQGQLQGLLDQVVAAGAPGATARVSDEDGVVQAASGVADLRTGRPMQPGLRFRVASVTKPFVATVVLQLVAEGRLSLTDTVARWLPGILPYGGQVTVRELLNHTGGVPDYEPVILPTVYGSPQGRFRVWTPRELVGLVADRPPDFPPGTAYSYSNTGYLLAGMIVEAVTGHRLGEELTRRILAPLGLRETFFPVNAPGLPAPYSRGYSLPHDQQEGPLLDLTALNPSLASAAGALVSTLGDVQRFFQALLGGRLLPPGLLAEMTSPVATGPPGLGYGLGVTVIDTPAGPLIGHGGAIPGFSNVVLSTADGRRQIAVMMNEYFSPPAVSDAYDQAFMTLALGVLVGQPPSSAVSTTAATAAATAWPHMT